MGLSLFACHQKRAPKLWSGPSQGPDPLLKLVIANFEADRTATRLEMIPFEREAIALVFEAIMQEQQNPRPLYFLKVSYQIPSDLLSELSGKNRQVESFEHATISVDPDGRTATILHSRSRKKVPVVSIRFQADTTGAVFKVDWVVFDKLAGHGESGHWILRISGEQFLLDKQ